MRVNPFAGYLDAFPRYYEERLISKTKLEEAGFPINPDLFLSDNGFGILPIKHQKEEFFSVQELIGFSRMYSIPSEGYVSKKFIRPAEILDVEFREDKETGENLINTIYVACAFLPPEDRRRGSGHVVFVCPFCGCIHFHGAGGEKFGDGNGDRVPHCTCEEPAYYRLDAQKIGYQLYKHWHFDLVETEDMSRAGDFPKYFSKYIQERRKG